MDMKLLCQFAHKAALDEIGEIEQRVGARKAGISGQLAVQELYRHPSRNTGWARREERVAKELKADMERLETLIPFVEELEVFFEKANEANDQIWVDAFKTAYPGMFSAKK